MAGLLDLLGGGDPNGSLYGDALTPEQLAALRQRGLLGFLGGLQKSGALDSTIPTLTGKMPGSFASGLAAGAGGMGEAMDSGALNAMRAQQLGLQTQQLRSQLSMRDKLMGALPGLLGGDQGGSAPQPSAAPASNGGLLAGGAVPNAAQGIAAMSPAAIKQAAIDAGFEGDAADKMTGIAMAESSGNPAAIGDSDKGGSYGLTQINADAHGPIAQTALNNPSQAMKLAYDISKGGTDFSPWTTYRTGAYKQFLPASDQGQAAPQGSLLGGGPAPSATPAAPGSLLPPAGSAAQPSPTLTNGINPRNLAAAGVMAQLSGIGDAFKPIENYYYNSPGQKGAVASAEKWAGVAPDLYTKWHAPMDVRANGMIADPSTGRVVLRNPAVPLGYTVGQGPNGPIAEEVPGALPGIANSEAARETGKNQANLGTGQQLPGSAAGQSTQGAVPGTPLAKDLVSAIPNYQEPLLSADELKSRIPVWTKEGRDMTASIGMAQQAEHRLMNIADAFKLTEPGAFATHKAELAAALKAADIPYPKSWDPASIQLALHENYRATLQNLAAVNKRFSQMEFKVTSEQSEHPNIQPSANFEMLGEDIGALRQMQGLGHDWQAAQVAGKHNLDAFESAWLKANPLNKISDAVKQEIGPLKGMPGTATAKDGDIVTNPKTGQRLQNRGGQWLDLQTLKPYSP